jgi:hypothetical protein
MVAHGVWPLRLAAIHPPAADAGRDDLYERTDDSIPDAGNSIRQAAARKIA